MNTIKMKIIGIDEDSQSLIVCFSSLEEEPNENNAVAFQPHFFGNVSKQNLYESIARSGASIIETQNKLKQAQLENSVNNYVSDIGKVIEIDLTPVTEQVAISNNLFHAEIRNVLLEEGLIK